MRAWALLLNNIILNLLERLLCVIVFQTDRVVINYFILCVASLKKLLSLRSRGCRTSDVRFYAQISPLL
jgi:hypothetical protein